MPNLDLPGLRLLRGYRPEWLRSDVVAGVVLAAYLLPASIGDASLAGLPPEAGLYSCLFGGLVFWLFCSSRHTAVTVTSALSLLVGTSLGELAGGDPARHAALAAATAAIVGGLALLAVVGGIVAAPVLDLSGRGVALLGEIPQGLPVPGLPDVGLSDLNLLLPLAMACFLLGAVETAAIGRMFGRKHGHRLDSNQELLALAGANLLAGLGRGLPVSGGMSQSLVNEGAGARTPLSGLVAAGLTLLVTLFLAGLLRDLPQPVLAAIVLMAVGGLFKISELRRLCRFSRTEFAVAMASLLGVLGSGLLRGVLIGAVISVLLLLRRASRPRTTELGRVPGTDYFADLLRYPENERLREVFVFRAEAALLYFNVEHVRDRFFELLNARGEGVKLAIFFLGTSPGVDLAGAEMLQELQEALQERGLDFRLAEARGDVRETLRRAGFEERCGPVVAHQTVAAVVAEWQGRPNPHSQNLETTT
jgi:MFS superfamily sulfate permease-like transporter